MSKFEVDSDRVMQASAAVSTSVTAIRGDVARMMANLVELGDTWRGSAATSFTGVVAQWQQAQTQVETALDAITAALGSAAATYDDAEARAARLFVAG